MKNIFIKSHQAAKEFKEKYNVDYHFQFSLFLKEYLKINQVEIKGTKRLVKLAVQIRDEMLSIIEDENIKNSLNQIDDCNFFINNRDLDAEKLENKIDMYNN